MKFDFHGMENLDRAVHAMLGKATLGISPAAIALAYADWASHIAIAPGKQMQLAQLYFNQLQRFGYYGLSYWRNHWEQVPTLLKALNKLDPTEAEATPPAVDKVDPLVKDARFKHQNWQQYPFNFIHQAFLLNQEWWSEATTHVRGVTQHHENVVSFVTRQIMDIFSPSNFIRTNPEVLEKTFTSGGSNLVQGFMNFLDDSQRNAMGQPPVGSEKFQVGKNIACTKGKVIFRNRLIELIQYSPTTETVHPEPVLIVPAWIMKYYILDLSDNNSFVKYLVDKGHTVFIISWKNPDVEDRDLGMEQYLSLGVLAAIEMIQKIIPNQKIHTAGYCLGGTILSIAAAILGRLGEENPLKSMTLLAAQTDFTEAGELMLFIDESQLSYLEDMMWQSGYLDTTQMAGAFQLLRSNDLIWSHIIKDYLLGERQSMNDLMAWNADATRMPYRMHAEYLRDLFLHNDLAEGRFRINDKPISLRNIHIPVFAVGTTKDHVAPWRSVHKIHFLTDTDVTFVLTSGGHNAGIVSEPGHRHRSYQMMTTKHQDNYLDPASWESRAPRFEGSWWEPWEAWVAIHSGAKTNVLPSMGAPDKDLPVLGDAPGIYIKG